jgi:hypothetical protein
MFEQASKMKLRFQTNRGMLSTEDLWDINLESLNNIAKGINRQLKDSMEVDFLEKPNQTDAILKLQFDIVLHILETKKKEKEGRDLITKKKAEKEKLLEILAKKKDGALEELSVEDLEKKIQELS